MSEFDAIAAGARDEVYATFGKAASYAPPGGGSSRPCVLLLDVRDTGARPEEGRPLAGQVTLRVRVSEVEQPLKGGVFRLDPSEGGAAYTVANRPQPVSRDGGEWKMWGE